jgi:hypothetical protein
MSTPLLTRIVLVKHHRLAEGMLAFGDLFAREVVDGPDDSAEIIYHFASGQRLCPVWRHILEDRSQHWVLAVVETLEDPSTGVRLPGIAPAVKVHAILDQHTPAGYEGNVDRYLEVIDRLKSHKINPAHVSGRYWCDAACRVVLGEEPDDPTPADIDNAGEPPCVA